MTDDKPEDIPRIIICGDPGPHTGCVHDPEANWAPVPGTARGGSVTDIATRLLVAIDEAEVSARSCEDEVGRERAGDMYADNSGIADRDSFPSYPWGSDSRELRFMAGAGHPQSVLAICSSHREIVQSHMVCQADYSLVSDRLANHQGWAEGFSRPVDLEAAVATAFARLSLSDHYLSILARAYGITEEDG